MACDCCGAMFVRARSNLKGITHCCSLACSTRLRATRHAHSRVGATTPTYRSWAGMKKRCDNPNDPKYPRYGGAGIRYDPRWASFDAFLEDMGERPPGTSIDRIDNSGGYSKANCRWATHMQQVMNRRCTRQI